MTPKPCNVFLYKKASMPYKPVNLFQENGASMSLCLDTEAYMTDTEACVANKPWYVCLDTEASMPYKPWNLRLYAEVSMAPKPWNLHNYDICLTLKNLSML